MGNLPANPCVIVVDDAHQRERDLSVLLALVRQHPTIKLILSSRPYAADYLQVLIRPGIDSRQLKRLDELRELSREDVKALARQALGSEYVRFGDRLASVTKDCPLAEMLNIDTKLYVFRYSKTNQVNLSTKHEFLKLMNKTNFLTHTSLKIANLI